MHAGFIWGGGCQLCLFQENEVITSQHCRLDEKRTQYANGSVNKCIAELARGTLAALTHWTVLRSSLLSTDIAASD